MLAARKEVVPGLLCMVRHDCMDRDTLKSLNPTGPHFTGGPEGGDGPDEAGGQRRRPQPEADEVARGAVAGPRRPGRHQVPAARRRCAPRILACCRHVR